MYFSLTYWCASRCLSTWRWCVCFYSYFYYSYRSPPPRDLSPRHVPAQVGGGHSLGSMHVNCGGFSGAWTAAPTLLANDYFDTLLSETWVAYTVHSIVVVDGSRS